MTIRKRKSAKRDLAVGDTVRSIAVGSVPAFEGKIVLALTAGSLFHVEHPNGKTYLRGHSEICRVEP